MPRTLDPVLQSGLENNSGSPIIRAHFARSDAATFTSSEILYYKLSNLKLEIKLAPFEFDIAPDTTYIQIERGLLVDGVEYTESSSWYIVRTIEIDYYGIMLEGHLFSLNNILISGDLAFNTFFDAFVAQTDVPHHTNIVSYLTDAEWWKTIQFLPNGTTLVLTDPYHIVAMLKKKYLVALFDIGENKVLPIGASMLTEFPATVPDHVLDYTKCPNFSYTTPKLSNRYYYWLDESKKFHYFGNYTNPRHDLEFIESTVTPILSSLSNSAFSVLLSPPRLDICNGDYINIPIPFYSVTEMQSRVFVDEIFDPGSKLTWYMKLKAVEWISDAIQLPTNENLLLPVYIRDWKVRTTPADNYWTGIAWSPELHLFAAVSITGIGNRVMTSPNGIDWTIRSTPADNNWISVSWSPELGLFAAVAISGTGNRVMTSPDGIVWTLRTTPADNNWYGLVWAPELELFAAVAYTGSTNRVMTSPDGINWTLQTTPNNNFLDITWSPDLGLFAAVAFTGTNQQVMTSPDGINWTLQTTPSIYSYRCIAWSPELHLFVAASITGTGDRVMTSPDGINWTLRTTPAIDASWYSIAWSPELRVFTAVAYSGANNCVMTSPDGITWTLRTTPANKNFFDIAWSPELCLFVAVAINGTGNRIVTSL